MSKRPTKHADSHPGTTGHVWDGIEELNSPLPRWWVWVFLITIVWGVAYTIAYPAWPMISSATRGMLGANMRADVAADIAAVDASHQAVQAALVAAPLEAIAADDALNSYAQSAGAAVFKTWCAQCHGAGAAGVEGKGYPNLLDDDWLWGGDMTAIHQTISHGIRSATDGDTRYSEMPKFGTDGLLEPEQIAAVVEYVLKISGQEHDAALATAGETIFVTDETCASCHMPDGTGNRDLGAPNLTDAIWLYGGSRAAITETVEKARFGVMPAWVGRLSEDEIRAVAVYVHAQGGGE
jgi:cytochrome c oxidase cbb3-type subunit 3